MTVTAYHATADTISHLVALVAQARPDWDSGLVRIVLHSHADQVTGNDLAVAALRCAANPDMPTPKAIGWRGPHWDGLATMPVEVAPRERCSVCGKTEPRCYSVRPGLDDDHVFDPVPLRVAAVR